MNKNEIIQIQGMEYKEMTKQLLNKCALATLIPSKVSLIGIKPNLVAPVPAEFGGTTHPEVVAGIIEYLQENGFTNLQIMEGSWVGDKTEESFEVCGYRMLSEQYGVPLIDAQKEKSMPVQCGDMELQICECAKKVDFMINVPVMKGHCQTKITCALKNMKGLLPNKEKRHFHAMGLHRPIAHLGLGIHQDFILVDNICGDLDFEDGGNPFIMNRLFAGLDPVLIDAYVCAELHYKPEDVPYVKMAEELGVGSADLTRLSIRQIGEIGEKRVIPEKRKIVELQDAVDKKGNKVNPDIKGVWFEKEYQRNYPFGSLASSVIGFTSSGNVGTTGLENYYNSTLNGINGREYGYLDSDSDFEKTVIDAQDGDTLVTSIDANIQSIVEEKIKDWNEKYRDNYYKGTGSINTAAIVMNPNNGEILAMADYPNVDLNNPRDLSKWYTKKQIKNMSEDEKMDALNEIWQNFCVSSTYEPGSVQKPFTVACGLETGTIKDKMTFDCDGYEDFNGQKVRCVARYGHGIETVRKTLMDSCNDAIMQMSYKIGKNHFTEYQSIYGFGQKTGIDLPGEANTASLMYQVEDMNRSGNQCIRTEL